MNEQAKLGQTTAWEAVGVAAQWSWERGWVVRVHGRRSGSDVWSYADLSADGEALLTDLLTTALDARGRDARVEDLEF